MLNVNLINRALFLKMIQLGAENLANHKEVINKLNVFPVPDGDTGTNMNLSMSSGVKEMTKRKDEELSVILSALIRGLLMGARGNSGVILSQLFRGFIERLKETQEISSKDFAEAFEFGVKTAYQSVTNPVEGTILTVAKDSAKRAVEVAETENDIIKIMEEVVKESKKSLKRTPELLPILKEVGVVDSGGKGLVVIFEGFLAALKNEKLPEREIEINMDKMVQLEHEQAVQSFISADSIQFGYCTEFFIELDENKLNMKPFDENLFRSQLSEYGDSLLVALDNQFVKIHIHTEEPGKVMNFAQSYGELVNIDIENMRKQYEAIVEENEENMSEQKKYGIITVASGSGLKEMFSSLGTTYIIEGGQTMNPSTEDVLKAVKKVNAEHIFILPNNKNIIMAANQAKLFSNKNITIIPTTTIPQGITALFSFEEEVEAEENEEIMLEAMQEVKTGLVTYATRDTEMNQMEIKQGDFIGLNEEMILINHSDKVETVKTLLEKIVEEDDEIITIFYGEDVTHKELIVLKKYIKNHIEEQEVEIHRGGQPVYSFIVMVE